ncbi:MAG TPA: YeaC family protein [Moraxellaceae bacterium]|nr:YeaC family protein [Moraxellaceae bacterium]
MSDTSFETLLATLTPELVAVFRRSIETGKWPDGRRLTDEQRATCMQAVIAWEHRHLPETERTGYIDKGEKDGDTCDSHDPAHDHEHEGTVKFLH